MHCHQQTSERGIRDVTMDPQVERVSLYSWNKHGAIEA
uniref:Uncharacterized protein n=1 Tax=Picea glauca TaxID=3330 RepID=A0A101LYG7_PICGL|nr:hypothetical protein ABT39_MTgene5854 [Picea glauca]